MDTRFQIHNLHHQRPELFEEMDPHLHTLKDVTYVYNSPLLNEIPVKTPGIYTLGGGRQIGKTTFLKKWIRNLIHQGVSPHKIVFLTGEIIDDHHSLINTITSLSCLKEEGGLSYLIIDEVTYIKDWDKAIKFLADSGQLSRVVLILSGSDLIFIKEARMRFPGRRGNASTIDFHMYPLSFKEVLYLKHGDDFLNFDHDCLMTSFRDYLIYGGYLTALNAFHKKGYIPASIYMTYSDWIRGDVIKRGKNEGYLREIIHAIVETCGSQITWNSLSHHISIDHPQTVRDYVSLLERMEALFIQSAIVEDKLSPAPKKAKKLFFTDPFIFHALQYWINGPQKVEEKTQNIQTEAFLVETVIINHFRRHYPTYYIKAGGEVDVAYVKKKKFFPVEVKWTNQLRPKDLKQISKYGDSLILSKLPDGEIQGMPTRFIPKFLLENI